MFFQGSLGRTSWLSHDSTKLSGKVSTDCKGYQGISMFRRAFLSPFQVLPSLLLVLLLVSRSARQLVSRSARPSRACAGQAGKLAFRALLGGVVRVRIKLITHPRASRSEPPFSLCPCRVGDKRAGNQPSLLAKKLANDQAGLAGPKVHRSQ